MDQVRILIETMGYIEKQVKLTPVESNIIPNTFVFESLHPFPGYHGENLPEKSIPSSLFLILNKEYSFEEILRITKKIKQKFNCDFNASTGNIYTKKSTYPCIRIKYLKSFTFLPELMMQYQEEGIKFAKSKAYNTDGIILINKTFLVENIEDGIYKDNFENSKSYIEVPVKLEWNEFVEMTTKIKNNIDNSNFDAALGVFYRNNGIVDVIRLYTGEREHEKVVQIRKMYLDCIKKR